MNTRSLTGVLSLALLLLLTAAPEAAACEPLDFDVEYILPITDAVPLNGSMLAYIQAPLGSLEDNTSLRTLGGEQIPVDVVAQADAGSESGLLFGKPLQPLEPNSTYIWSIYGREHVFTTGDGADLEPPTFDEVVVSYTGIETTSGCFGAIYEWHAYELEVTGVNEPVAIYARLLPVSGGLRVYAEYQAPLTILAPLEPEHDLCFEVSIEDHGGNVVSAGTTCLGLVEGGDGDGDGDETETGESGGPDETGTGDESDTETGGAGVDTGEKACACRADASPGQAAVWALLSLALLKPRRRRQPL